MYSPPVLRKETKMEKGKKKIIAGAGVLVGTGLAYLLLGRKRPPQEGDKKCIEFDLHEYRQGQWVLVEANSPACGWQPPGEETGIIQGYVVGRETGEHIPNAAIYLDGEFALYSWTWDVGGYRIAGISYGTHIITVEANNYETTDFQIVVDRPIQSISLEMPPLPPAPGEWSEGVEVQSVSVDPPIAYQGETINIKVYIQYGIHDPDAYPTYPPATIFGTVKINGEELTGEFTIDYRNPTLGFPYTTTQTGEFTVVAQDKSAKFTVAESPVGTYYSPFGGRRMPVCTKIIVPNVEPFIAIGEEFPGGDYVIPDERLRWGVEPWECRAFFPPGGGYPNCYYGSVPYKCSDTPAEVRERFLDAYPVEWDTGEVGAWTSHLYKGGLLVPYGNFILIAPTEWDCKPYWDTKDELARIIVIQGQYRIHKLEDFENFLSTHGGRVDPEAGYRDWVKPIEWKVRGFQGHVRAELSCPYCSTKVTYANRIVPYLDMARQLLEHIEQEHPDHPLTEPAWV